MAITPEQRSEMVKWLRDESKFWSKETIGKRASKTAADALQSEPEKDAQIAALTAERDGLAEMVRQLREVLAVYGDGMNWYISGDGNLCWHCEPGKPNGTDMAEAALALQLPEAVEAAKRQKEEGNVTR